MVNFPSQPPTPPPRPGGGLNEVYFFLKFSQSLQALQSAHLEEHPHFEQIHSSATDLLQQLQTAERKIKQLCEQNGWTFDETTANFNQCVESLKEVLISHADPSAIVASAQSASTLAEKIFNRINPPE